jgi:hypothetical protein
MRFAAARWRIPAGFTTRQPLVDSGALPRPTELQAGCRSGGSSSASSALRDRAGALFATGGFHDSGWRNFPRTFVRHCIEVSGEPKEGRSTCPYDTAHLSSS